MKPGLLGPPNRWKLSRVQPSNKRANTAHFTDNRIKEADLGIILRFPWTCPLGYRHSFSCITFSSGQRMLSKQDTLEQARGRGIFCNNPALCWGGSYTVLRTSCITICTFNQTLQKAAEIIRNIILASSASRWKWPSLTSVDGSRVE